MESANNKIVKNTFFLYGRMIFLTLINLYTVRITLEALGVEDYGIYSVIASFIALFSIISSTLTSATQRFLSFHLGRNDYEAYSKTFSLLLICFVLLALIITAIAEILGIFAFDGLLNIPDNKISAAKWVYQTSIVTFIIYLLTIPFTSSIVSNEKMSAFAYISILDGIAKLIIVFILLSVPNKRLILYGFLTLGEALLVFISYVIYCRIKFRYYRISWIWDRGLFKELSAYTSWNLFGSLSSTLAIQGQSILLNVFFGPIINTAKSIADKIHNVIYSFSTNFYLAISPQIIKSYAANDLDRMLTLGIMSSKLSFLLLYLVSFPLICSMGPLLIIWLGIDGHTEDTVGFSRLVLLQGLVGCLEPPITHMIRATGNIKKYQMKVGVLTLLYLPVAWLALKIWHSPLLSMWVLICVYAFVQIIRVLQAKKQVGLNTKIYLKSVILPIVVLVLISYPLYYAIVNINLKNPISTCSLQIIVSLVISIVLIFIIGLNHHERVYLKDLILHKILKKI